MRPGARLLLLLALQFGAGLTAPAPARAEPAGQAAAGVRKLQDLVLYQDDKI